MACIWTARNQFTKKNPSSLREKRSRGTEAVRVRKGLRMKRWIERALDIQPGDLRSGVLLSSCLFLTISGAVVGKVASNALFLAQFPAVQLPYADIASGVLVGFVVAANLRMRRRG